ncbi:hypothetical protein ACQRIU_001280 [Beauveria bassiana]
MDGDSRNMLCRGMVNNILGLEAFITAPSRSAPHHRFSFLVISVITSRTTTSQSPVPSKLASIDLVSKEK